MVPSDIRLWCAFFFEDTVTLEVLKVIGILDKAVVQGVGTCVVVSAYSSTCEKQALKEAVGRSCV